MKLGKAVAFAMTLLVARSPAFGQAPSGWSFEITPYAWLAGLEGDVQVKGRGAEFDKAVDDLFEETKIGGSVRIGVQCDRLVLGGLVDRLSLTTDELAVEGGGTGGSLDTDILLAEVLAGYRLDGRAEGQSFVLGAGVRALQAEHELRLPGRETLRAENDVTDAMLFVLPSVPVLPSKIEGLRFNPVLGIGAGDSKLAYELFPQFQYRIAGAVTARLGYRTVGWKIKGDEPADHESSFRLAGLIAGLGMTF